MMLLKSCPRCHGDMILEELPGDAEFVCLQCGHRTYPDSQTRLAGAAAGVGKKAA